MDFKKIKTAVQRITKSKTSSLKWSFVTLGITFGIMGGAVLTVFTVDPFYRYRMPFFYDTVYYEIYATAPALLKSHDYELFMLGTSMARNFFLEDIKKTFGVPAIKFAASGGTIGDLRKFIDIAVEAKGKKLKHVVLSLDTYPFNKPFAHWEDFDYLYRKDYSQEYRYLFDRRTYSSIYFLFKRKTSPKRQRPYMADPNRMFATEYPGKPYGLREVMKDVIHCQAIHHILTLYDPAAHKKNLYEVLLPVIDNNPDIKFTVYLPPYHIYAFCLNEHFKEIEPLYVQRSAIMKELLKRPNVTLHDFQSSTKYVLNHDYFSDVQHFSNVAAKEVLKDLVAETHRLKTQKEIERNEMALRKLVKEKMADYYAHQKQFKRK